MQIQPSIFKTYDIRGIYGQDFDETLAYDLGLAYTNWRSRELSTNNLSVVIGHDMRLSSPELHQALSCGLLDGGAEIIDIGLCATPSFYFAVANERADGGLMITASHNPKDYNGFKIVRDRARPCLLYTSDAADDLPCVDLGGRRIITKKKTINK